MSDSNKSASDLLNEMDEGRKHKKARDGKAANWIMAAVVLLIAVVILVNTGALDSMAGAMRQAAGLLEKIG